jgi:predicted AAA+ superfamily ATPase
MPDADVPNDPSPPEAAASEAERWATRLPAPAEAFLRTQNPWWRGEADAPAPRFRRWLFEPLLHRLHRGLAPITVLRGPRQVGKSVLQHQIIHHLLDVEDLDPRRIFHVQFDQLPDLAAGGMPILRLALWYEHNVLGGSGIGGAFNAWARRGEPVYLLFDEIQNLQGWAPELKSLVDQHEVRVLLTGSSALRIEKGRDSLAGRISTLEIGTLTLCEIMELRGWGALTPAMGLNNLGALKERAFWEGLAASGRRQREPRDRAFSAFAERGGYPVAQVRAEERWDDLAEYLEETVIRRVLGHDLQRGTEDPKIREEVFRIACRYAGQDPGPKVFLPALRGALELDLPWTAVLDELRDLADSLLLRRIPPVELRLKRQEQRHKICLCDHSLRAAWLREPTPLTPEALARSPAQARLAGPLAESIAGSLFAAISGIGVAWLPPRGDKPEIDFILTVGDLRIPVEVKYRQRIDARRDLRGLLSYIDRDVNLAPFGLLVTLRDDVEPMDPRVVSLPLASLLLLR